MEGCMSNLNKFVMGLIVLLTGLAALHSYLIPLIGDDWFMLIIFTVLLIGGRVSLYFYRSDRGRKDDLFTRPWWTAL